MGMSCFHKVFLLSERSREIFSGAPSDFSAPKQPSHGIAYREYKKYCADEAWFQGLHGRALKRMNRQYQESHSGGGMDPKQVAHNDDGAL